METRDGQWVFSFSPDYWDPDNYFDRKEECIQEATKEARNRGLEDGVFRIGQVEHLKIEDSFEIEDILDSIHNYFSSNVGEAAEDYLISVNKKHQEILKDNLSKTIADWMAQFNYRPSWFMHNVTNEEEIAF